MDAGSSSDTDGSAVSSSSAGTRRDTSTFTPTSKKPRYACTFHPDLNQFTWGKVSMKGPSFAYCKICSCNISVVYGGNKDLNKHEQTAIYRAGSGSVAASTSMTLYFHKP